MSSNSNIGNIVSVEEEERRRRSLDSKAYWLFCQDPECPECNEYTNTVKHIIVDNQLLILYPEVPEIPEDGVPIKVANPKEVEILDISDTGNFSKIAVRKTEIRFEIEDRILKDDIMLDDKLMCSPVCKNPLCRKWWKELYRTSTAGFVPSQKQVKKENSLKNNASANSANDNAGNLNSA